MDQIIVPDILLTWRSNHVHHKFSSVQEIHSPLFVDNNAHYFFARFSTSIFRFFQVAIGPGS